MIGRAQPLALHYRVGRALLRLYLGVLCRIRVEGGDLPSGPFVLSMNHRSALDMFLYVAILPRRIKFLAKREVLAYPLLGRLLSRWCVPVNRGGYDRRALDLSAQALRDGFVLSVFPEGTRRARLAVAHGGAVVLASRTGVPVVPGAILGSYSLLDTVTVRFGQPMRFPPDMNRQQRHEGTVALMNTIRALGASATEPPRRSWRDRWRLRRHHRHARRRQRDEDQREQAG